MSYQPFPLPRSGSGGVPPAYQLVFGEDHDAPKPKRQTLVRARDSEEMATLVALLGEACEIALSEPFRQQRPALASDVIRLAEALPGDRGLLSIDVLRETLRRLPLALGSLVGTGLALDDDDPLPAPLDRRYAHKKRPPIS